MYKIHSKLVFLKKKLTKKKLNTLKKNKKNKKIKNKKIHAVQVNSARELHCSLFLTWTVQFSCTVHEQCIILHCSCYLHCSLHSAITWTVQKKASNSCFANIAFPTQKKVGPSEQYTIFFGNQTAATAF